MKQNVYFVRHGLRTDHELHGVEKARDLEANDPPLSEEGHKQTRELGVWFKGRHLQYIVSSPFLRCLQTARSVAQEVGLPIKVERGIMEALCEFTAAPRLGFDQPGDLDFDVDPSYTSQCMPTFPESLSETYERAGDVVRTLVETLEGDILFIGHEYTAIAGTRSLLRKTETEMPLGCPTTGVFHLTRCSDKGNNQDWNLVENAAIKHLSDPVKAFLGVEENEVALWLRYHGMTSLSEIRIGQD